MASLQGKTIFASPSGNNALTPYFSPNEPTASGSSSPKPPQTPPAASPPPAPVVEPEPEPEDILLRAEKTKEKGNVAFKGGKYAEAVDLYTLTVGAQDHIRIKCFSNRLFVFLELNPLEPSFLTNRAYMALKRLRPALEDCQVAAHCSLQHPQQRHSFALLDVNWHWDHPPPPYPQLETSSL